ncbi:MAG: hypothetical protein EWV75_06800 [Microcystis wesenbergii Mw_QC_S_20081001_S30D]|jgi:hypothetical protein|uniref:Uncharacterized protein n=1 Tax=Microcystis wesenbergii Mw_QC_S_20081001_S30D TaxID=2486245 RepID=A0A552JRW3_9CHRO|nr:hypothetical protein [Microcystis aeruginosa W11-03]NCR96026.1 hypothetical protein [Microcystis aeruginosa W11-06]TRU94680.1 MAG: hypothetical protein EWV74_21355 [Microcystis wesenbergii Mw_QC_S_20081001_S30]TRU98492.1 MAG: hypothetical protein EWV75_06800 [Microcystis wesenbergii Mw_QC_S_20081001_S30D]TRV05429.1 MAG: hypothetical protein EWV73_00680 [Microcystis wesenbergii Mw_QC_B_20070930_S4D]TRV13522.1 MAG: hypothetical protein EWV89_10990 [Microcystis wesenbergii Mw_QC_B_20070930_S4]
MSKVVSFSLNNKQLETLKALYPNDSVNLSAKAAILSILDTSNLTLNNTYVLSSSITSNSKLDESGLFNSSVKKEIDDRIDNLERAFSDQLLAITERVSGVEAENQALKNAFSAFMGKAVGLGRTQHTEPLSLPVLEGIRGDINTAEGGTFTESPHLYPIETIETPKEDIPAQGESISKAIDNWPIL